MDDIASEATAEDASLEVIQQTPISDQIAINSTNETDKIDNVEKTGPFGFDRLSPPEIRHMIYSILGFKRAEIFEITYNKESKTFYFTEACFPVALRFSSESRNAMLSSRNLLEVQSEVKISEERTTIRAYLKTDQTVYLQMTDSIEEGPASSQKPYSAARLLLARLRNNKIVDAITSLAIPHLVSISSAGTDELRHTFDKDYAKELGQYPLLEKLTLVTPEVLPADPPKIIRFVSRAHPQGGNGITRDAHGKIHVDFHQYKLHNDGRQVRERLERFRDWLRGLYVSDLPGQKDMPGAAWIDTIQITSAYADRGLPDPYPQRKAKC